MSHQSTSQSLTRIISEDDFVPLAREASVDFLSLLAALGEVGEAPVNKLFFFTLLKEAEKLENMLDDHGARSNLRFVYFAEMVACVRNLSLAAFQVYHILERYNDYLSASRDNVRMEFEKDAKRALDFLSRTITCFRQSLLAEAAAMGMPEPPKKQIPSGAWQVRQAPRLPYTIGGVESANPMERIVSLAQAYRRVFKQFRQQGLHRRLKAKDLPELVPSRINETMMAGFEGLLHNIQSDYDTHIKGTLIERENQWCVTLRGLTAIPMHLFDCTAWIIHFFERHENQAKGSVGARISALVDNAEMLWAITGFGVVQAGRYLAEGNEVAERILSMYVTPITYELPLPRPQGFHARPATYVSLVAQEHGTDAFLIVDGKKYSCRSVLELLEAGGALADKNAKTALFEGDKRCLDDLKILSDSNYCEDRDIPQELNYLRILRNM